MLCFIFCITFSSLFTKMIFILNWTSWRLKTFFCLHKTYVLEFFKSHFPSNNIYLYIYKHHLIFIDIFFLNCLLFIRTLLTCQYITSLLHSNGFCRVFYNICNSKIIKLQKFWIKVNCSSCSELVQIKLIWKKENLL